MKYILISIMLLLSFEKKRVIFNNDMEVITQHFEKIHNKEYCFFVDFSIHSGKKRMFLYNVKDRRVIKSFLVAHGKGSGNKNGKPIKFSNIPGSNMSSVGVSEIGERNHSNYGINIKYWLKGLDRTNNKMQKRVVVLHSWKGIPDYEIYPFVIENSEGCFTVSNNSMKYIDNFIKKQKNKKILIYAYQ